MKERLKCKSFDWFMREIAYDVFDKYPKLPANKYWGELRNEANDNCLDTYGRHPPEKVNSFNSPYGRHCDISNCLTKGGP